MIPETQDVPAILASSSIFLSEDGDDQSTRRKHEGCNKLAVRCSTVLTHLSDHSIIITMRANPDPNEILAIFDTQRSMIETDPDGPQILNFLKMKGRI